VADADHLSAAYVNMWVDARLVRRREVNRLYTYGRYTRPPPLSPRVLIPPATTTGWTHSPDLNALVAQFDGATVLSRPCRRTREVRQEIRESSALLQSVKNGYPLDHVIRAPPPDFPIEERRGIHVTGPDTFSLKAEYAYPPGAIARDCAADIRNEVNWLRHSINEEDRERNNSMITDMNRRRRRRRYAIIHEFDDYRRFGREEAHLRALRREQLSALREQRAEDWWPVFVREAGENGSDVGIVRLFADTKEFDEHGIERLYRKAIGTYRNYESVRELIDHANELAQFLPPYKLHMILDKVERKTGKRPARSFS
jgi:hypothetical protein